MLHGLTEASGPVSEIRGFPVDLGSPEWGKN